MMFHTINHMINHMTNYKMIFSKTSHDYHMTNLMKNHMINHMTNHMINYIINYMINNVINHMIFFSRVETSFYIKTLNAKVIDNIKTKRLPIEHFFVRSISDELVINTKFKS